MNHESFETMRRAMVVSQLRTNSVDDPRVIAAMAAVERERFVPADRAASSYVDRPVPLAAGRALNPPMATGLLLNAAALKASDRALLIGAASGYTAAVLARLVASVTALEEDTALAEAASAALAGIGGVAIVTGPLAAGWPEAAPYDAIIVDGAIEAVPPAIAEQLAENGRLATGIVEDGVIRLSVGRRGGAGFGLRTFADAEAVRLPGFAKPAGFRF